MKRNMQLVLALSMVMAVSTVAISSSYAQNDSAKTEQTTTVNKTDDSKKKEESKYVDGVYEGTARGYSSDIKVKVTVSGGAIKSVELLSQNDTPIYFNAEKAKILADNIVKTQSIKVDALAGATISSNGFMKAVSNALESVQAPLTVESNKDSEEKSLDAQEKTYPSMEITNPERTNEKPKVKIRNAKVSKNALISDTLRDGAVVLENITIDGDLVIRGAEEVSLNNCKITGKVIIDKQIRKRINVVLDDKTKLNRLVVKTPAKIQTKGAGEIATLELSDILGSEYQTVIDAKVKELDIKTVNADISVEKNSKVDSIKLPDNVDKFEKTKKTYKNKENTFKLEVNSSISKGSNTNVPYKVVYGYSNVDQAEYPDLKLFLRPPFYDMRVKVVLDKNNKIVEVANDSTQIKGLMPGAQEKDWMKHERYWNRMTAGNIYDKFAGKTLEQVKAMKMRKGEADVVSGATADSIAIKQAVINAMEGRKGKMFLTDKQTLTPITPIIEIGTTTVKFTNTLPKDFKLKLLNVSQGVFNGEDIIKDVKLSEDGTVLTIPNDLKPGLYYVNIVDESGAYRSPDFVSGERDKERTNMHYPYFVVKSKETLKFEGNKLSVSDNDLANIYKNIESITITDKKAKESDSKYKPVKVEPVTVEGRLRIKATEVFDENGKIKETAKDLGKANIFENGKEYEIEVKVWGFDEPLKFNYVAGK